MNTLIIEGLILLTAFPVAYFLIYLCKDEIRGWRKRLNVISLISLILAIVMFFTEFEFKVPIIITCFFVIIMNFTIVYSIFSK